MTPSRTAPIWIVSLVVLLHLIGCGDPVGAPCEIAGSGFHTSHNCAVQCLQYREIVCPDGTQIRPRMCSGRAGCEPGTCPDGQLCYHVADPFEDERYCVPDDMCGSPLTGEAASTWEQASMERADQLRAQWERRREARDAARKAKEVTTPQ